MSWSIERIEKELLLCEVGVTALPSGVVVQAVNRVEQTLGPEWIEAEVASAKGIAPAMQVIGMGLRLAALEHLEKSDQLVTNLQRRHQNADAELTAIHLFVSSEPSVQVELHPAVGNRRADFRLRRADDEQWTVVEVTQPGSSEERQRLEEILRRITDAFEKLEHPFSLNIVFVREPSDNEIAILCERLPEFCRLSGRQQATLVDGMGFLFLNYVEIGHLMLPEVPELADTPMIGVTAFFPSPSGGGPHHQVSVGLPFTEARAERILKFEAAQLPKGNEPGLVMINVATNAKELRGWVSLIERRFQPTIHTRVSGVCLFSGAMVQVKDRYDWLLQTKALVNQHATIQLPDWIRNAINAAGEEFERAAPDHPTSEGSA